MSLLFRQDRDQTLALSVTALCVVFLPAMVLLQGARAIAEGCGFESVTGDQTALFVRHLPTSCTQEERERLAVQAAEILHALRGGKGIDLAGVVVSGDLFLDQLPKESFASSELPAGLKGTLQSQHVNDVRLIRGPLSIRESQVRGQIATNLKEGVVVVLGPVVTTGTTFERQLDLSHTAFVGTVDFSDSILVRESFFVRALFTQGARFERTAFGIHSRFHRAVFGGPVTFLRAGFNGLAEFLEVSFEGEASFSRAYFKLGTGFSGSRFHRGADFSEATFEREAYFLFTHFDGDAYFRRATFRSTADFSDGEFKGLDDFSKVYFDVPPTFKGTKWGADRPLGGLQNPKIFMLIIAALLAFTLVFILLLRKI